MSILRTIADGLRSLFRKKQAGQELEEEVNGFLEMAAQEKLKQRLSRKEALRAVRLERGSSDITKEEVRSAGWESFLETCWQDLRFAVRMPGIHANAPQASWARPLRIRTLGWFHADPPSPALARRSQPCTRVWQRKSSIRRRGPGRPIFRAKVL